VESVWCWDRLEGQEITPRLVARLRHISLFACRVWQRERLAPAWMTALDGLLGTNDHGLGRQDGHRRRLTLGAGGRLLEWPTPSPAR
jgi:hypothetical protein